MKDRYQEHLDDWTPVYRQMGWVEYDARVGPLISRYQELFLKIQSWSQETSNGWERIEDINPEDKEEMKKIKRILQEEQQKWGRWKNILGFSSWNDERIGHGKDNTVFIFWDGEDSMGSYVYKEAIPPKDENGKDYKEMTGKNLRYLQRKYALLRKFLWATIPQSVFILWDTSRKDWPASGLPNMDNARQTTITIQRRIRGKTLKEMSPQEKKNIEFLSALQKAHRQYVLLKIFIQTIAEEQWFAGDTLDVKMDLWRLSDMETLDINNPNTIKEGLKSPNIMYDGKNIYFIDFDQGEWTEQKELLFTYLLSDEVQERWKIMKKSLGLV